MLGYRRVLKLTSKLWVLGYRRVLKLTSELKGNGKELRLMGVITKVLYILAVGFIY